MDVGRHKGIGVKEEGIAAFVFAQKPEVEIVIVSGLENFSALISPGNDVVKSSWKMDSRFSCHEQFLSKRKFFVNTYLIMPDPVGGWRIGAIGL
jgi:hypothetical protein